MAKQKREYMIYDELNKFTSEPKESTHSYDLRFAKLINDINMIPMSMIPMQINTKFVNHLQPEWSRFVTTAKQARNIHRNNQASGARVINAVQNIGANQPMLQAIANFKAGHVDAYDSDCDDEATANVIFMANFSHISSLNDDTIVPRYDSDTLSEVRHYDTYHDFDVLNSNIQELGYMETSASTLEVRLSRSNLEIGLWYLDSGCSKHMTGHRDKLINFVSKFIRTVQFANDHFAAIMGYGDLQMGNILISRIYYVKGLGHNLFFVGYDEVFFNLSTFQSLKDEILVMEPSSLSLKLRYHQ
uniref:Copia-type polyprotein n=1 Tax=Tanacetum cinerariifolium TaxID=118510 RepID=A0A6L2KKK8_TANCI|nr:copia-type polyprotein [Tanacetum cinerariifolium]